MERFVRTEYRLKYKDEYLCYELLPASGGYEFTVPVFKLESSTCEPPASFDSRENAVHAIGCHHYEFDNDDFPKDFVKDVRNRLKAIQIVKVQVVETVEEVKVNFESALEYFKKRGMLDD